MNFLEISGVIMWSACLLVGWFGWRTMRTAIEMERGVREAERIARASPSEDGKVQLQEQVVAVVKETKTGFTKVFTN